jgi:hypothetical protein
LKATVNDGSFYDGAQVWWGPSDDGRRLVLHPFPQLQIANERDVRRWFPLEEFPYRTELSVFGFQQGEPIAIKPFGVERDTAARLLVEKGYEVSAFEEARSPEQAPDVRIRISGAIDRTLMRAVAKIAFNYLAYQYRSIAMMEQFSDARRFVRFDAPLTPVPVSLAPGDLLAGLPKNKVPVAHAVGVAWKNGKVVGQVTFFFQFHYRVILADGGFAIPPETIGIGHLFDPVNHRIHELTPDPRRGRPLPRP